ncbi:MAG: ParB/RepB/Spo0J family partition protein [Phycisphaerae bacterium]
MVKHTLQQMSVDSIVPSKDNARHIDQKSVGFQELVNSIRAGGVQIPIHVWPHPKRKGKYEIRAGERRWRACKSLGYKSIPTIVHRGIGYDVAMALTYTENKFREDLAPLEEVEEIARCMDHLNSDANLIAVLLGQTEQWVRLRANIHRNLIQEWSQAFLNRERYQCFQNWSVGHLTLVARLPANSQKELLRDIKSYPWQWTNVSVHDLDGRISSALMLLIKAKWNLDDDTLLPKAGACSECNKRSGSEPVLWFGITGNQIKSKDRCLDQRCWKSKMQVYLQQRAKQLSEKHSNLAYMATEHLSDDEKDEMTKTFGRVLDQYDVQRSTKGSKGSIPALVVHGKGAGTVNYVREKQFARPAGTRRAGQVTPLKERRTHLKARRWSQVLIVLHEKVEAAGVDQVIYKDKITGIMALASIYGNRSIFPGFEEKNRREIDAMIKKADDGGREKALELLWSSMKPTLDNLLTYAGPVTQIAQYVIDNARWIAELIKVDIDEIFNDVSKQKGFTEPKSWKNLNADGTLKVAGKPKEKKSA